MAATRTTGKTMFDRVADRLMAVESGAYGDERERGILMEANAFGLSLGIFATLGVGFVLALLGQLLAPFLLVLLAILPASAANLYARRRHVDAAELAERSGARSTQMLTVVAGLAVTAVFAAMTVTVLAGDPVLPAPDDRPRGAFLGGLVQGGVVGGMLGGLATVVGGLVSMAKSRRHAS